MKNVMYNACADANTPCAYQNLELSPNMKKKEKKKQQQKKNMRKCRKKARQIL